MLINYLFIILCGFLLGIFFISIFKKFTIRHGVLISKGIPLIGGIGMGLSFVFVSLFSSFFYQGLSREIIGVIISAIIMLIFGIIDDSRQLSIKAKFLIQIVAAFLLILFSIRTQIVYIGDLLNIIITFVWVLGISNAFNHLDVIDGLAAGCGTIIGFGFFVVAILNGDTRIAILSLALSAATLSCFIYNFPPAKIYMGNAGSHFLGFTLAAVALVMSYASLERKIALLSPLLILGFPIFDTAFLILMRLKQKKSVFRKSNDHIALRFFKMGYSKVKTLMFMLSLCLFFSLCGIVVSQVSNQWGVAIITFVLLLSLGLTIKMSKVSIND